jgi:hypothetical protein
LKKILSVLKYLALLAVGVFLFYLVYAKADYSSILQKIEQIKYLYIVLAFIAAVLAHWSRGARWNLLIRPMGYKVSDFNSFLAVMIGYFANLALPRAGEVSRCVVLNRTNKIPVDKLIGTVIVERLVDMITLLAILALALVLQFNKLKTFFKDFIDRTMQSTGPHLFSIGTIAIVVLAILFLIGLAFWLYRRLKNHAVVIKIRNMITGFIAGMKTIGQLENRWLFIFHSIFIWAMYYMMVYICFFALPFTADLGPVVALSVLVMGSFGFVAPVQGGVGAYHLIVTQTLMAYGLSQADGQTFALVAHTFQMLVIVLLGAISFLILTFSYKKLKTDDAAPADTAEAI